MESISQNPLVKTFRFDDVCINANTDLVYDIVRYLKNKFLDCKIVLGISPLVHSNCGERIFPRIFNAYSDYRNFYKVDEAGLPEIPTHAWDFVLAAHGLFHIDHRLLTYECQEMSIIASCSLTKSKIFIPPFNKWDANTEMVCAENGIELVKFEDGWRCLEYESYDPSHHLYYLHAREWTVDKIKKWFDGPND